MKGKVRKRVAVTSSVCPEVLFTIGSVERCLECDPKWVWVLRSAEVFLCIQSVSNLTLGVFMVLLLRSGLLKPPDYTITLSANTAVGAAESELQSTQIAKATEFVFLRRVIHKIMCYIKGV